MWVKRMKKIEEYIDNNKEFDDIIGELIKNYKVQQMKKYRQHCDVSCYEHCYNAAHICYVVSKKLGWDYESATRAAMLHDLFLYDWRVKGDRKGHHAFTHPKLACYNASKIFDLNEKEKDIILKHMWPLTISLPQSKEGFLLTFVDKYSAVAESTKYFYKCLVKNEILKYAYLILAFVTRINL